MRLVATADLHFNHPRSTEPAKAVIDDINSAGGDVLLVVGDAAIADGDSLESCLNRFDFDGPKLYVPGNHELWSNRDNVDLLDDELPRRVRAAGWRYLPDEPFEQGDVAVVGSIGWYDYSFVVESLGIPRAFYEAGVSPGAAIAAGVPPELVTLARHLPEHSRSIVARWNDHRFAKKPMSDSELFEREIARLESQLNSMQHKRHVVVATHTVPFRELLPARHAGVFSFARAYLGGDRLGETIRRFECVGTVLCGHSHTEAAASIDRIRAINIGSGYRVKRFVQLDV